MIFGWKVSHETSAVAIVEDPSQGFGQCIGRVDDARDVVKDDVATFFPILDCEELNIDMATPLRGDTVVDYVDCGHVVFVEDGW
jgi:hypothetical protein